MEINVAIPLTNPHFSIYHNIYHARAVDKRQTIETLISEEALLLAKFLRSERKTWTPRIAAV